MQSKVVADHPKQFTSVKVSILKPALRTLLQETVIDPADDDDYIEAFDFLLQMIDFWEDRGVFVWSSKPLSMNAGVSREDPIFTMWTNLAVFMASHFNYEPTNRQKTQAAQSFRVIRNRQRGPALMNRPSKMPRGSGNSYYSRGRSWIYLDGDCTDVVNNQGAKVIVGKNIDVM